MNGRVQVFARGAERPRLVLGSRGLFVGQLVRPKGVATDSAGNIYVIESYYDHLLVYDREGRFLLPSAVWQAGRGVLPPVGNLDRRARPRLRGGHVQRPRGGAAVPRGRGRWRALASRRPCSRRPRRSPFSPRPRSSCAPPHFRRAQHEAQPLRLGRRSRQELDGEPDLRLLPHAARRHARRDAPLEPGARHDHLHALHVIVARCAGDPGRARPTRGQLETVPFVPRRHGGHRQRERAERRGFRGHARHRLDPDDRKREPAARCPRAVAPRPASRGT